MRDSVLLTIEGFDGPLRVTRMRGVERIHEPFRFEITADTRPSLAETAALDADALLGKKAEIEIAHESAPRVVGGIVDAIEEVAHGHRFTIVPELALLGDEVDHRVFVDLDALAIMDEVLAARGLKAERRVTRSLPARPQCVQAFETNLGFIQRILAEEGVTLHLERIDGEETIVVADSTSAYEPFEDPGEIPYSDAHGEGMRAAEAVYAAELGRAMAPTKASLGDFDFERPMVDQQVAEGDGALERYEYPGGYVDPVVGQALAKLRLEEAQQRKQTLQGRTTCRRLRPGSTFRLDRAPRDDMAGPWLVIELEHEAEEREGRGGEPSRYEARFVAVPAESPYRPTRPEAPTLGGVQTAVTTGPAGAEIHPDKHGRIKAHFRWDRLRERDDTSSAWLRAVQVPTSGGLFLPRVGWEVLLGFQGTSGDRPYELGRLYNAEAPPPEGLPGKKVCSAFGTLTTPGGGGANLLRMDDTAGSEGMTLAASRDYNERTENDKATTIKADDVRSIGANRTAIVGIASSTTIDGAQSYSVGGSRDLTCVGNFTIETGTESVSVGGARMFKVGGDYETQAATLLRVVGALKSELAIQEVSRHVSGVSTVLVGGAWTEVGGVHSGTSVLGASTLNVGGPMEISAKDYSLKASALKEDYASRSVRAGGAHSESFGATAKYGIGGSLSMKGANVYFKADSDITLKASGVTITITPDAIKIKGDFDSSEASVVTGKDVNE